MNTVAARRSYATPARSAAGPGTDSAACASIGSTGGLSVPGPHSRPTGPSARVRQTSRRRPRERRASSIRGAQRPVKGAPRGSCGTVTACVAGPAPAPCRAARGLRMRHRPPRPYPARRGLARRGPGRPQAPRRPPARTTGHGGGAAPLPHARPCGHDGAVPRAHGVTMPGQGLRLGGTGAAGAAPDNVLEFLALLPGQPANPNRLRHPASPCWLENSFPTSTTSNPASLPGHSTRGRRVPCHGCLPPSQGPCSPASSPASAPASSRA